MKRLIPVGLVMLALSAAFADTHYVDPVKGVDEENDGTDPSRPLRTIEASLAAVTTGDTLMVADGTNYITRPMWASKHLRIIGASGDPSKAIIDAQGKCSCVSNTVQWILSGLTFQNGYNEGTDKYGACGAGISSTGSGTTSISNCVIRNCCGHLKAGVQAYGGGVYLDGEELGDRFGSTTEMVDCLVENCALVSESPDTSKTYAIYGGGVYVKKGVLRNVTIRNCSVTNSSAKASDAGSCGGGGLAIRGNAQATGCVITNCFCVDTTGGTGGAGGGVYLDYAKIAGNRAVLRDSLVVDNRAPYAGGGVFMYGPATLSGCTVRGNGLTAHLTASSLLHGGGGVYAGNSSTQITIENCLVEENFAANEDRSAGYFNGGGLYVYRAGGVTVSNTVVRNNLSNYAAGGCAFYGKNGEGTNFVVRNCVVEGNVSTNYSAAFYFYGTVDALVENSLVKSNVSASGSGGIGYVVTSGSYFKGLTYRNCLFTSNCGAHVGFGFYLHGLSHTFTGSEFLTFDHCTFAGNTCGTSSRYLIQAATNNDAKYGKLRMTGCAFVNNMAGNKYLRGIQPYTGGATNIFRCWADADDGVPTVDPSLGNFTGGDPGFVDAETGDVRLTAGSPLIGKGGPFEDWMGNGRRKSVRDMGDGTYALTPVGKYGVSVTMNNTCPRRGAADASDIGCCSYWTSPGLLLLFR